MLICVTYICPTFTYNSTGCNCTAARQQFSACVLFTSSSIEITAVANPSLVCFVLSVTITSLSATTSLALRLQSQRLPLLAYMCVHTRLCVHMWLSKGSTHAVSGLARCCGVTVDLFSSWLLLLEVCRAHKSQGLILLSHSKKEGCDYNACLSQTLTTFKVSFPSYCCPLLSSFPWPNEHF